MAQERAGDAAMGALSGAVVFGPVGALAGAVVGYTTGPAIAHAWGVRRHDRYRHPGPGNASAQAGRTAAPAAKTAAQSAPPATAGSGGAARSPAMTPAQSFE
jgi:hypothetical protein